MTGNSPHSHLWPGVPLAIGSAVLFGAAAPFSKYLLTVIHPYMLAGLLYFSAGLGLAIYKVLRTNTNEAALRRKDMPWLLLSVTLGGAVAPVLLMLGLQLTSASNASLLLNVETLATMMIAWLVYRENVDRRLLLGAAAILAGAVLLAWQPQDLGFDSGALLVVGACLAWGFDNNFTRKISATDPVVIAMLKGLVAGSVNIAIALSLGGGLPGFRFVALASGVGALSIGVSLVMFILALRHLGTARTGAYYSLAPFIGATLSVVALGEPITPYLLAAGGLMAIGLWLHLSERHVHEHVHDSMEHDHVHSHDEHHTHPHEGLVAEQHSHRHKHAPMKHSHVHYPDLHHRHEH